MPALPHSTALQVVCVACAGYVLVFCCRQPGGKQPSLFALEHPERINPAKVARNRLCFMTARRGSRFFRAELLRPQKPPVVVGLQLPPGFIWCARSFVSNGKFLASGRSTSDIGGSLSSPSRRAAAQSDSSLMNVVIKSYRNRFFSEL